MKYVKEYGFLILKFLGFILAGNLLLSVFYYFFLPTKVLNVFLFIYMILGLFIFGVLAGKKANNKGFLEGFKTGLLFIAILVLFNLLIYQSSFSVMRLIYYVVLLFSCVFGAMLGINTKKSGNWIITFLFIYLI